MKVRRGRSERGQATIEFAIVLPLVLLLVAGIIEFGKGFNYWLNLNHLANEGARWVAVDKIPPTRRRTRDLAERPELRPRQHHHRGIAGKCQH